MKAYCCNGECNWEGPLEECVHPKHDPEYLLCPECYEVVEIELKGEPK